jgi:hypothetical protein
MLSLTIEQASAKRDSLKQMKNKPRAITGVETKETLMKPQRRSIA